VFGDSLAYEKIRIHECISITNFIDQVGKRLQGKKPQAAHNAITLGNHCFFPIRLPETLLQPGHPDHNKISWLIHELTHSWQYQHLGWKYLYLALKAQLIEKGKAYDFGYEEGLKRRRREGWKLSQFNMEQQGDICRSYYDRLCRGQDVSHWQPFIDQIQRTT
jgi:hypothetical protein